MSPDGKNIVLSGTLQAAELEEHAHGVRIAYLQLLGLLAHADGLHAFILDLVEISLVVQLEPHDVARLGIFALKGLACFGFVHTIFIHAYHTYIIMVFQKLLGPLPESVFNDVVHMAAGIAIDEDGVFCGLGHLDDLF